ncbi:unnamed protein product [Schistosoma margrebowiei]|uniref:Uncharacterized protein n=1 Tax=Schistosoma margrebowiei TaxID=48269 RepID=A0AA85AMT7_9TREM|nr:unnamed protein product [Schistosoma margrebowiei]
MNMINFLLSIVFILPIFFLNGVNADKRVFDLVEFIVELWKNFCWQLSGTFKCFLDRMDPAIGGKGYSCIGKGGVVFNLEELILGIWANLCERLAGTWRCLLEVLPEDLGGRTTPCYSTMKK